MFGKSFVEFWVVKLPATLSFVFLGVHYYGGFIFIGGLMIMSFRSVRFLRASCSCLIRLSAIFKCLVFSISVVIKGLVQVLCFCLE